MSLRRSFPLLVALSGCAMTPRGPTLQQRITDLEHAQPDATALGRGDLTSTGRVFEAMSQTADRVELDDRLARADKDALIARVHAAEKRFRLAAATLAAPDIAYWLGHTALVPGDSDTLGLVRRLADARVEDRQHRFATTHTYFNQPAGPMMWQTHSSVSVANGEVVDARTSKRLVETPGNCVFATEAFGPEGTPNPTLVFRVTGLHPRVHVRCYLSHRPEALPAAGAELAVKIKHDGGTFVKMLPIPHGGHGERAQLDFVLDEHGAGWLVDPEAAYENLQVDIVYRYAKDNVVVWERGAQRVRVEVVTKMLASSPLFWDRDGTPPVIAHR